jgi:hypothetical protein
MPPLDLELDTVVVATDGHVSSTLEDEEVILDLTSGTYYGLNPVGRHIWSFIQSPKPVRAVCDHVLEAFDAKPDQVEQDVISLLRDMESEDLVRVESSK